MPTAICYHIIYNESTSAFEKHGLDNITSASDTWTTDAGTFSGISGTCDTYGHYLVFDISGTNQIDELNTSADSAFGVTSANSDLADAVELGNQQTSGSPDVSGVTDNEVNEMKVTINIKAITPVIKTVYAPLDKILPTSVVKR